jgi:hypothetical protein
MKITPKQAQESVKTFSTTSDKKSATVDFEWWKAKSKQELGEKMIACATFMKTNQTYRQRQVAIFARMYGNVSLYNFIGNSTSKIDQISGLPQDRPTFNLVQSATDTLVSRISQNRPSPVFLTDNSDYKERNLAKKLNNFVSGEFYQTKTYEKTPIILRDALVAGTGCLHGFRTDDNKVGLERVLLTELFTDTNDSIYGEPRSLYRVKLIDRQVLLNSFPEYRKIVETAAKAYADNGAESNKSISDMVMVVEGWHLKSGENAKDGRHSIACSSGTLLDESYDKDRFPFVFLHYSPRMLGFWAQGLAEQLMGTQMEINALLSTITKAIRLVGVPRVFVENGSKIVKAHLNNDVGSIVTYSGTKPEYSIAPCVPQEMYAQLQRLIDYGYQQCGVSALSASSQKPAGLNSGEAIRSYDDISTDRFASLSRKYDNLFVDLAYLVTDIAKEIAEDTGEYQTVYPGKDGTKKIDFPKLELLKDPFVIQCFNMSSLPRDPAGRLQKVTEMVQSNMITLKEGRRLMDFPDLQQIEKLANAGEERIFQILDEIVEEGKYTPPDPFMDLQLASETAVQYINLYGSAKLEEEKMQMLRNFYTQVGAVMQAAQPPAPAGPMPGAPADGGQTPQAVPAPLPQSDILPRG